MHTLPPSSLLSTKEGRCCRKTFSCTNSFVRLLDRPVREEGGRLYIVCAPKKPKSSEKKKLAETKHVNCIAETNASVYFEQNSFPSLLIGQQSTFLLACKKSKICIRANRRRARVWIIPASLALPSRHR